MWTSLGPFKIILTSFSLRLDAPSNNIIHVEASFYLKLGTGVSSTTKYASILCLDSSS